MKGSRVEYDSNNSGGDWWLSDDDWRALAGAGWEVKWFKDRFLGALATEAVRRGLNLREAVAEWERVTGKCSTDAGCPCCGPPHYFREYDAHGKIIASGPSCNYEASWD